ncbi:hypothetical protein C8R45DRAFT_938411 [Mycena sanguinolenta]|nr:hypothetical protein C8R45DRAFT_938411 [Mycena sanguinolenta]
MQSGRWRRCAGIAVVVVVVAVLWLVVKLLRPRYNPMDNYQDLNTLPVTVVPAAQHVPLNRRAVVSSLESYGYAIGVAVAGHSARRANVTARLLLPYSEHRVSERALCIARAVGWEPYRVALIPPPHGGKDVYSGFKKQYTKLHIWTLEEGSGQCRLYHRPHSGLTEFRRTIRYPVPLCRQSRCTSGPSGL